MRDQGGEGDFHGRFVGDIGDQSQRPTACCDKRRYSVVDLVRPVTENADGRTFRGQPKGRCSADAGRCAGDQSDFSR